MISKEKNFYCLSCRATWLAHKGSQAMASLISPTPKGCNRGFYSPNVKQFEFVMCSEPLERCNLNANSSDSIIWIVPESYLCKQLDFYRVLKLLVKIKVPENEQTPAQINFTKGKFAATFLETFLRKYVMY